MAKAFLRIQDSAVDINCIVSFKKHDYKIKGEKKFTLSLNMINRVGEDIGFLNEKDRDNAFNVLLGIVLGDKQDFDEQFNMLEKARTKPNKQEIENARKYGFSKDICKQVARGKA